MVLLLLEDCNMVERANEEDETEAGLLEPRGTGSTRRDSPANKDHDRSHIIFEEIATYQREHNIQHCASIHLSSSVHLAVRLHLVRWQ